MMDYIEENSDHDPHTSNRKNNVGVEETGDSVEESQIKNSSDNLDPLTEAFNSFHNLQEVLKEELQKFQELGKEPKSLIHDEAESSTCIHTGHERANEASSSYRFRSENMGDLRLTSLDSEILNLVNNVNHLETKLEETKSIIEAKNSLISELESNINISEPLNRGAEIGIEDIFCQKMEAEIEYLIISTSKENLKRRIKVIEEEKILAEEQAHRMLLKLGEVETKAEKLKIKAQDLENCCVEIGEIQEVKSLKKRVSKITSCLLIQLGLLFMLFSFQYMPESETVVPT